MEQPSKQREFHKSSWNWLVVKETKQKTFKLSLSFTGKGNHVLTIGLPQTINGNEYPIPHVHPIPYSKYIQYEDLLDASGWEDDDLVRKTCSPNWCKDAPNLVVSKAVGKEIKFKKKELGYDETYNENPYLQEMVLCSLHTVSIFGCNKLLNPECKWRSICGIKINLGSEGFDFLGSAHVIEISWTLMIKLPSIWDGTQNHLKSQTMSSNSFLSRKSNQIRTKDGLSSQKRSSHVSAKLLTKSKVWPYIQSCHALLIIQISIY